MDPLRAWVSSRVSAAEEKLSARSWRYLYRKWVAAGSDRRTSVLDEPSALTYPSRMNSDSSSDDTLPFKHKVAFGGCEVIIQRADSKRSLPGSHVILEAIETLIECADISFWIKFDDELTPEEFFASVLTRLAMAWKGYRDWDERDYKQLTPHELLTEMLEELSEGHHLPERLPYAADSDEDEDLEDVNGDNDG